MSDQSMIEASVADANGAVLDWMILKALGAKWKEGHPFGTKENSAKFDAWVFPDGTASTSFRPSTEWAHGGPLIDQFRPSLYPHHYNEWESCVPETMDDRFNEKFNEIAEAPTALVAAMRAIVFAELGDHVSVPAELLGGGA